MPRTSPEPVLFQIGFNKCGTKFLTALFEQNGYKACHWNGGRLAEDIAFSKQKGIEPLKNWADVTMFSDMESVHRLHSPMLEGFKEFKYLSESFPEAVFILNERNIEEWIASRYFHQGGEYRRFHAHHLGVAEHDLPELWWKDWETHIFNCTQFFNESVRFVRFDLDNDDPRELADWLANWYDLKTIPEFNIDARLAIRQQRLLKLWEAVSPSETPKQPGTKSTDTDFCQSMAEFCLAKPTNSSAGLSKSEMSQIFAHWDGGSNVVDRENAALPLTLSEPLPHGRFLRSVSVPKLERIQGVINECLNLGMPRELDIDMQDARRYGTDELLPPEHPIITYNRRASAPHMTLWPLPGYHSPGHRHYVHDSPIDRTRFEDKIDQVAWRGNLTGRPWPELLTDPQTPLRASHRILKNLEQNHRRGISNDNLIKELQGISRYMFVKRFIHHTDFNIGFALTNSHRIAAETDLLRDLCRTRERTEWFFKFRYLVSLSGHDTGSNFLMAANSNSVVMKEEDGWELFYSSSFRKWEHYIPLNLGATDIEEKLEWARANPKRCKDIVAASQDVCSKLANAANRDYYLRCILEGHSASV